MRLPHRRDVRALLAPVVAVSCAYWILFTAVHVLRFAPYPFLDRRGVAVSALINTLSWIVIWLTSVWAAARLPLAGARALRNLVLLILLAGTMLLGRIAALHWLLTPTGWFAGESLLHAVARLLPINILTFAMFWIGGWAVVHAYRVEALALAAEVRRTHVMRARLAALMTQLQPHFLGNTLHGISTLIYCDPQEALRAFRRLRSVISDVVGEPEQVELPLAKELDFTRRWLQIQKQRFGERLELRIDADPEALALWVPKLVLQPLVENVIKHAVSRCHTTVHAAVAARVHGNRLRLTVTDDGPGLQGGGTEIHGGTGLSNTRQRVHVLYGAAGTFAVENRPTGGVVAVVEIPVQRQPLVPQAPPSPRLPAAPAGGSLKIAEPVPALAAAAVVVLSFGVCDAILTPELGPAGMARASLLAALQLASVLIPAAVALRLPGYFRSARPAALAASIAIVGGVSAAAFLVFVAGVERVVNDFIWPASALPGHILTLWLLQLGVLAAAFVAPALAERVRTLRVLEQQEQRAARASAPALSCLANAPDFEHAFDVIDRAIGSDPGAANRALTQLAQRLSPSMAAPASSRPTPVAPASIRRG